jgi:hypothetical protein
MPANIGEERETPEGAVAMCWRPHAKARAPHGHHRFREGAGPADDAVSQWLVFIKRRSTTSSTRWRVAASSTWWCSARLDPLCSRPNSVGDGLIWLVFNPTVRTGKPTTSLSLDKPPHHFFRVWFILFELEPCSCERLRITLSPYFLNQTESN